MKTIKEFALKYRHSLWIISYLLFYLLGGSVALLSGVLGVVFSSLCGG